MKFTQFICTKYAGLRPGQWLILIGTIGQVIALVALVLTTGGCADIPHNPPVGIWEGGMRMPNDQACYIDTENGQTMLKACK